MTQEGAYVTQGDANDASDGEAVKGSSVLGKLLVDIPLLGYLVAFAQTGVGFVVMIIIPATLIVYSELASIKKEVGKLKSNGAVA